MRYSNHCTATNKKGRPCGAWAIRGGNVCRIHGGMAPQVQRKARERLEANSDFIADALVEAMQRQGVTAQTAGRGLPAPWGERLKKALEVVEGRYEQTAPSAKSPARRATRPAGPPAAAPEPAVAPPDRPVDDAEPLRRPTSAPPPFATPTRPPSSALATLEDALGDIATANRRARALQARRVRRQR